MWWDCLPLTQFGSEKRLEPDSSHAPVGEPAGVR